MTNQQQSEARTARRSPNENAQEQLLATLPVNERRLELAEALLRALLRAAPDNA